MKLVLLAAAFAQATALATYTFTCTGADPTCLTHASMIIVGDSPTAARYHMLCTRGGNGVNGACPAYVATSINELPDPSGNSLFDANGAGFTLVTAERVHFVTSSLFPNNVAAANSAFGRASGLGLTDDFNGEFDMPVAGSTNPIVLSPGVAPTTGPAVSVNCKTATGATTGMLTVQIGTETAITVPCSASAMSGAIEDGVFLDFQDTNGAADVTVTVQPPQFIMSGGPNPTERSEFSATYATGVNFLATCTNGSTSCVFPIGTINHVLIGGTPVLPVPPTTCAVSCTSFLTSNGCTAATQNVANVSAATCANGATPLVVRDNCGATGNNTAEIQCIGIVTATDLLAGAAFGDSLVTLFALAAANGQLQQVYVALQTGRIGYAISSVCLASCVTGRVDEETDYFVAFCITPCTINTRRQVAVPGASPVIVCPYPTAAQQRACFQESVCNGGLLTTDTCFVLGVAESCPTCPLARVSSDSKKGLYGLLGLLALIPLLLCCCCLLLALLLCLRRRKPAEPIMMPMTAAYPCMPEPCAVVPSCTPDVHCTTNAFACY